MSYLRGFRNDVFISYAHIDNRPDRAGEPGWVESFARALELRLLKRFGQEVGVWRDPELARSQRFDPVIEEAVKGSAVMLCLISQSYLISDYCRQEVEWFAAKAAGEPPGLTVDHHVRLFPLLLYNVPPDEWPEPCRNTSGFRFHDALDRGFGRPLNPNGDAFTDQVCRVAEELHAVLHAIQKQAVASTPRAATSSPSVFLADVSDDVRRERRHLLEQLQKAGIEVVRGIPPPDDRSGHEAAVIAALGRSRLSIHLLGGVPGRPIDEEKPDETYPVEQLRLGLEHAGSQLVVVPPALQQQDIEERAYSDLVRSLQERPREADRLEVVRVNREQMLEEVLAKLRRLEAAETQSPTAAPTQATAFVDLHVNDLASAGDLLTHLQRHHIQAVTIPSADLDPAAGLSLFEEHLKRARLFIVVFGHVVRGWVEQRLNEAFKLMLSNRLNTRVGVYLAPPHKSPSEAAFPPIFQVMDNSRHFDPKTLDPLLRDASETS